MSDRTAILFALSVAAVAVLAPPLPPAACVLVLAAWFVVRHPLLLAVAVLVLVGGRSHQSLAALGAPLPAVVDAPASLVSDPEEQRFGTRFVLRVEGRRYVAEVPRERASPVRRLLTGDEVHVRGRPSALRNAPVGWVRSQHLAGRLAVSEITDERRTPPWYRVANAVHRALGAGASSMGEHRPLYLGLVIGDDRGQSDLTQFRFEASGLTHLLAVSGSNVAFVLAVADPVMARVGRHGRLVLGASLLVLFALVTRAEPSVLRATVMAAVALGAMSAGRAAPPVRVLALGVVALLVADPLLVHSLGFQLSVAATAGLILLAAPIAARLPGPRWLSLPLAVTVAAQLATAPLLLVTNGHLPAAATLANLAAVPAAGAVMVLGVTLGLVAGLVGDGTAAVLQVPALLLVRWIDLVATLASRLPLPVLGPGRLALCAVAVGAAVVATSAWRRRRDARPGGARPLTVQVVAGAAVAVTAGMAALVPAVPTVGERTLVEGVRVAVGACGGTVVVLDGTGQDRAVLRALWAAGVRRADVLVVGPSRADASTALTVARQLDVRTVVGVAQRTPPGIEPLGERTLGVGGVWVRAGVAARGDPEAQVGLDAHRCSLAR